MDIPVFDSNIMQFVQQNFHNSLTDAVFPVITYLGDKGMIWITIAVALLFFKKTRSCGMVCLLAMGSVFLFGEIWLKNVVCRVRPCNVFPEVSLLIPRPLSYSFPSGHSSASFAAAAVIFGFFKKAGIAAFVLAALIAFSRVFLFVHFPTDIIAGTLLGILFAMAALWIYRKGFLNRKKKKKKGTV